VQIAEAAERLCSILFVVDDADEHTRTILPVLESLAPVVATSGGVGAVGSELARRGTSGIVTFSQPRVELTAAIAESAGLSFHSPRAAHSLVYKSEQRRALAANGIVIPAWAMVPAPRDIFSAIDLVGTPAVLKPESGGGSEHTYAIDTPSDAVAAERELLRAGGHVPFILEKRLGGCAHPSSSKLADYVSVETIAFRGAFRHMCVADKPPLANPFRETGMVLPSSLDGELAADVVELAEGALRACGVMDGAAQTEIKLTPEGPRVIEVNGRLGGSVHRLVARRSSLRPIRLAVQVALGIEPQVAPDFNGLSVQYFVQPPPDAMRIVIPPDADDLLAVPGVYAVDGRSESGAQLDSSVGTLGRVCTVWAEASALEEALSTIDQVMAVAEAAVYE
jgi:biotin carboxylase